MAQQLLLVILTVGLLIEESILGTVKALASPHPDRVLGSGELKTWAKDADENARML